MIVKDESHVILHTLQNLIKYFHFDSYAISDTGSSDTTKEDITLFFNDLGIPGKVYDDEWKDFGHNRTRALEHAYGTSDYVLVWDADDSIVGEFVLPKELTYDSYLFTFGPGTVYSRAQLFNNRKRWQYVGVLHEYPRCNEDAGPSFAVVGNYHFVSGKSGNRSKDPNKYLNDATILEKAFYEAYAAKDQIYNRYAYYTAQSYNSCNHHEKAIEFYKKVLTLDNWLQEKYVSCFEIYDQYVLMKQEEEGLRFLVEGHRYDPRRVECIYRLVKYYCIKGQDDVALAYYSLIQSYYENEYLTDNLANRLFAKSPEYEFFLPYYMIIVSGRSKKYDIAIKMYTIIFTKAFQVGSWWIHNLFTNLQFTIPSQNPAFVDQMLTYVYFLRDNGIQLKSEHYTILDKVVAANRITGPTIIPAYKLHRAPRVMLTITTCKRLDLFEQTMHSILRTWTDFADIDYFFCVDDNSSLEDRLAMQKKFPFFNYYMKTPKEKGHRESMNIIWNKLQELKPTYWIHLEDDWLFLTSEQYVRRGISLLDKYESQKIHQLVFNREYGLMIQDLDRTSGVLLEKGVWLHTQTEVQGKNCAYWPHYSMQPSIVRTSTILELGNYTSPNTFFERDYANKYAAAGYKTMFFNGIYSLHIGKQHWEKEGKNAYALNEEGQFVQESVTVPKQVIHEITRGPLIGTMREHLEQVLKKIEAGQPFGLIRPSDGEHKILHNTTLTNCDRWTFTAGSILQKQLMSAIQTVDPNLYIGIPCNTCNTPWNCTPTIYEDYTVKWNVPAAQRTYANIFGNSNWPRFTEFLRGYTPGFVLITSGDHTLELPIKERFLIDSTLVNHWDAEHEAETARLLRCIAGKQGELICFSAGPLSKYWIPLCMKENPHNTYLDVGASLDIFTKGITNREYTTPGARFAKDSCHFAPMKNLVYMCVFYNEAYLELLKILLSTMKLFSRTDSMDILVFTSKEFAPKVQGISDLLDLPILIHTFAFTNFEEAACARLHIFDYPKIHRYGKILYIDTDIICQNDLSRMLEHDLENKVYALPEGTIEHEYHGGWFFDFTTIDKDAEGMNSGILLFKNTAEIRSLFVDIRAHIRESTKMPACVDQPFINYHVIKRNLQDTMFLKKYARIYCIDPPLPPSEPTDIILCHFVWPIGNPTHKRDRMLCHMEHVWEHYADIYGSISEPTVMKSYYWSTHGKIRFDPNHILTTSWGPGTYKWLDSSTVMASWSNFSHVLRMNADYSSFLSVRVSDFDCIRGYNKGTIVSAYDKNVKYSGGYGDRIVGMVSCKLLADRLDRTFKIHWEKENIEPYFNYAKYKWNPSPATTYKLIDKTAPNDFPEPIVKLYVNHDICGPLYYNDMIREYATLYTELLIPTPILQQSVHQLLKDIDTPIIGIQIRTGDAYITGEAYIALQNADEVIPNLLRDIQRHIEQTYSVYSVFLTSDYDRAYVFAKDIWKTNLIYNDQSIQHLDRNPTNISKIFADNYILSQKTVSLYISEWSNYGRVAALSAPHANIYNLSCIPLRKESLLSKESKNILYFCVFHNKQYFRLAALMLKSLQHFSEPRTFDILLLTSSDFQAEAEELRTILPIIIHYMPCTSIFEAACARLCIFDYPGSQKYEKILYLDTDIVIKKDLAPLFAEPLTEVLYGLESGTIASPSFGNQFFDFTKIDPATTGINSGTLLFRNCAAIRDLFTRIRVHIASYTGPNPYTLDQPFINYHAIRDKMYNNTLLKKHVSLYEGETVDNYETSCICHFSFPIGNADHKYTRMENMYSNLLVIPKHLFSLHTS